MPELSTRFEWGAGRQLAAKLVLNHPELLKGVPPMSDILFVMDKEGTPKKQGQPVLARVSKIPTKFTDFVYQGNKAFMLEWFEVNQSSMTVNQKQVLMIHELLHFEYDGDTDDYPFKLRGHDFEDFRVLLDRFGYRWSNPTYGDVPDVLATDFEWGKQGQARLNLSDQPEAAAEPPATDGAGDTPPVETTEPKQPEDGAAPSGPPADDWQPPQPLVTKDNVVQFRGLQHAQSDTGTGDPA